MGESYYEDTESLRKRKYYRITKDGRKLLDHKKQEWNLFSTTINKVIGGLSVNDMPINDNKHEPANEKDTFLQTLCGEIKHKKIRPVIAEEYDNHIEA